MYFDLSRPQRLLAQAVREFCQRRCRIGRVRELMETESAFDHPLWSEIAGQGWIGLHLAEEFDGLGLGIVELAVVAEELGRACLPGPWLSVNWAATMLAMAGGSAAMAHLPKIIDGDRLVTVAALEEGGSWDLDARHLATTLDSDLTLTGQKESVLQAQQADVLLCVVRRKHNLCLVLVPIDSEGVRVTATPGIDPTRKLARCEFDNVKLRPEQVVACDEAAMSVWESSLHVAMVAAGAEMLGLMQWMLETTTEFARTRQQFGREIGAFQAIQHHCADMLMLTESARSAVWYAAWALQEKTPEAAHAAAVAKIFVSDAVRQAGNLAVQVHGGIGFTWEHDLHLYYKRAKADEHLFGDASFHREQLAELVFRDT